MKKYAWYDVGLQRRHYKRYYEHPIDGILGVATTTAEQAAYRTAGFGLMPLTEVAGFVRDVLRKPAGLIYRWTIGGPDKFVTLNAFLRVLHEPRMPRV